MERIDVNLVKNGLIRSRTLASKLIESGCVSVNGKVITKPSEKIQGDENIEISDSPDLRYVSRGGLKLEAALNEFGITPVGKRCIDIGASTGGFTDCLLKNGAGSVVSVENGKNQLAEELLCDARVTSLENTDARSLDEKIGTFDIAVMDVSFISQTLIYPAIKRILNPNGIFISLIKPQFEAGKEYIGKGGIVKNKKAYDIVIEKIKFNAELNSLKLIKYIPSPILGGSGNKEYLAIFERE